MIFLLLVLLVLVALIASATSYYRGTLIIDVGIWRRQEFGTTIQATEIIPLAIMKAARTCGRVNFVRAVHGLSGGRAGGVLVDFSLANGIDGHCLTPC
jgi:hypothetical protein